MKRPKPRQIERYRMSLFNTEEDEGMIRSYEYYFPLAEWGWDLKYSRGVEGFLSEIDGIPRNKIFIRDREELEYVTR